MPDPSTLTPPRDFQQHLADLEQQAEFFVVLGDEDAAVDLLMSHLRSSGGTRGRMAVRRLLESRVSWASRASVGEFSTACRAVTA